MLPSLRSVPPLPTLDSEVPVALRATFAQMLQEIRLLEEKILDVERHLNALTRADVRVQQLRQIPGIGALTAPRARRCRRYPALHLRPSFRFWLGLIPASAPVQRGVDWERFPSKVIPYLRTLLSRCSIHIARRPSRRTGRALPRSVAARWALDCERQRGHNKATLRSPIVSPASSGDLEV